MRFLKRSFEHFLKISLLLILCVPTVFLSSNLASAAATACSCYCGDSKDGAVAEGSKPSVSACSAACQEKDKLFIGCYPPKVSTPEDDAKCWTEAECTNYAQDTAGNPQPGTFGGQNSHCVKTKLGDETGYCYGQPTGVKLNVPVLGQATVYGFHEYLALAYKFLLPAMSLIAVVMVMVGGLEYLVSGGNAKRLDKAKKRISDALIGLVILMSAYAVAALLDPRLVNLAALRTPMIKTVVFLDPNSFCEQLIPYGFEINPGFGPCGAQGKIDSINEEAATQLKHNFKVGDYCDFSECSLGKACVTFNGVNSCMACSDIGGLLGTRPAASSVLCNEIAVRADAFDKNAGHKYSCLMTYEGVNACVTYTYDNEPYINCPKIREEAGKLEDPCKVYEDLLVTSGAAGSMASSLAKSSVNDSSQTACKADLCEVVALKGFKGCKFAYGSGIGGDSTGATSYYNTCTGVK